MCIIHISISKSFYLITRQNFTDLNLKLNFEANKYLLKAQRSYRYDKNCIVITKSQNCKCYVLDFPKMKRKSYYAIQETDTNG